MAKVYLSEAVSAYLRYRRKSYTSKLQMAEKYVIIAYIGNKYVPFKTLDENIILLINEQTIIGNEHRGFFITKCCI